MRLITSSDKINAMDMQRESITVVNSQPDEIIYTCYGINEYSHKMQKSEMIYEKLKSGKLMPLSSSLTPIKVIPAFEEVISAIQESEINPNIKVYFGKVLPDINQLRCTKVRVPKKKDFPIRLNVEKMF